MQQTIHGASCIYIMTKTHLTRTTYQESSPGTQCEVRHVWQAKMLDAFRLTIGRNIGILREKNYTYSWQLSHQVFWQNNIQVSKQYLKKTPNSGFIQIFGTGDLLIAKLHKTTTSQCFLQMH